MSSYSVSLLPAARRDLRRLPPEVHNRIAAAITRLENNPRPPGCKKLVGFENEWRLRAGDYRVLYLIDDAAKRVTIARVAHRREAYRSMR
ncbi:MAG TPA: type II toxin-antitoxin system RelE/ParE family toxin [Terriglobia bacterium]|nr:type II toxin-antitoxin system RelE/ParE family toxin [Terriglobia bacterium]